MISLNSLGLCLGDFSSVQEVGIGLLLGLAILQVIGSGEISNLVRRTKRLKLSAKSLSDASIKEKILRLENDLNMIEIGIFSVSRTIFSVVLGLLIIALGVLSYSTLFPDVNIEWGWALAILLQNLVVPIVIFVISSRTIRGRCADLRVRIAETEKVLARMLV